MSALPKDRTFALASLLTVDGHVAVPYPLTVLTVGVCHSQDSPDSVAPEPLYVLMVPNPITLSNPSSLPGFPSRVPTRSKHALSQKNLQGAKVKIAQLSGLRQGR